MSKAWVTTCNKVGIVEVAKAKELLLKEKVKELTFRVFIIGYSSHFYLIGGADRFVAAQELDITINLIQYDGEDYIHIREFDFIPKEGFKLVDNTGLVKIGDFYDMYGWEGNMYQVEVNDLFIVGL